MILPSRSEDNPWPLLSSSILLSLSLALSSSTSSSFEETEEDDDSDEDEEDDEVKDISGEIGAKALL